MSEETPIEYWTHQQGSRDAEIAKLEAELAHLKDKNLVLLSGRAELWLENQDMKEVIKRALEYRLEDVMRKSDIRKLEQAVGK